MTVDRKPEHRINPRFFMQRMAISAALLLEACAQTSPVQVVGYNSKEGGYRTITVKCYTDGPYTADERIPGFTDGEEINVGGQNVMRQGDTIIIPEPVDSLMNVYPIEDRVDGQGLGYTIGTVTFTAAISNNTLAIKAVCFDKPDSASVNTP